MTHYTKIVKVAIFLLAILPAQAVRAENVLRLTLTPVAASEATHTGLQVFYTLHDAELQRSRLQLRFDSLEPSLSRSTDQVHDLLVSDEAGVLSMDRPMKGDSGTWQIWTSRRSVIGAITVRYFVPVALAHPLKRGPQIDFQAAGGGVSGALRSVLLLPAMPSTIKLLLHWHLARQQTAVSSLGIGDLQATTTLALLNDTLFLAGPVKSYPNPAPPQGLSMFALGETAASLADAYKWIHAAYETERVALRASQDAPFRILIRSYDGGPIDSGHANNTSFLLYLPPSLMPGAQRVRDLLAHEMVHVFTQELTADPDSEGDWYTEGIADYLKMTLPASSHLYSKKQYVDLVNEEAALYYTNQNRSLSNQEAAAAKWSVANAWSLLYARGALYFADLDAKLRAHHLNVSVPELIDEMNRRILAGAPRTDETWLEVLRAKVGAWAIDDWTSMREGHLIIPATGAFGPCVAGEQIQAGFFDLGFTPARASAGTAIQSVQTASHAAEAGVQKGDVITDSVDLIPFESSFDRPMVLHTRRSGQLKTFRYDPHREEKVTAMRWRPSTGNTACELF